MILIARVIAISLGSALFVSSMAPSARAIGGDQFLSLCSKNADEPDQDFCRGYPLYSIELGLLWVKTGLTGVSPGRSVPEG